MSALGESALGEFGLDAVALGALVGADIVLMAGSASASSGDAVAPGDIVEIDASVIPGEATGNGDTSIGWWGPPAPYLRPDYRMPRRHIPRIDAVVAGQRVTIDHRFTPGAACGDASDPGRVMMVNFQIIAGEARGYSRPSLVRPPRPPVAETEAESFPKEITWGWQNPWRRAVAVRKRAAAAPRGPSGWSSASGVRENAAGRPRAPSGWRRAGR